MHEHPRLLIDRSAWLGLCLAGLLVFPALGEEKEGMPDMCQIEQTCLPTSTGNLIIWFGKHGYPKLILSGATEDERYLHTVHGIMADTKARFDFGTEQEAITSGISRYIHECGYSCDVEYRGLDWMKAINAEKKARGENVVDEIKPPLAFDQGWLQENNDPNKGFILLLQYCRYDEANHVFTSAYNAGHAVTLVNAEKDMILIHDPAHYEDETGRKILTPEVLTFGTWREREMNASVVGLLLLSGSLMGAPPDAGIMLSGAVCITMHPANEAGGATTVNQVNGPSGNIAGGGSGSSTTKPSAPTAPSSSSASWTMWLFDLLFRK